MSALAAFVTGEMTPARRAREPRENVALLLIDRDSGTIDDRSAADLPQLLDPGDVVVLNDAATLPASVQAITVHGAVELRFTGPPGGDIAEAVLFGEGDFRIDTEARRAPPLLAVGDRVWIGQLVATVTGVSDLSPRLVTLSIDSESAVAQAL